MKGVVEGSGKRSDSGVGVFVRVEEGGGGGLFDGWVFCQGCINSINL